MIVTPNNFETSTAELRKVCLKFCCLIANRKDYGFFGFLDISNKDYLIVNHLLLLFKYYVYNARERKHLVLEALMKNIKNIYDIEKNF